MPLSSTQSNPTLVNTINNQQKALQYAFPHLVWARFGRGDNVAKRVGTTIRWFRPVAGAAITTLLDTGSAKTWAPANHSVTEVTATMKLWLSDGRQSEEMLTENSVWDIEPDMVRSEAETAGVSLDTIVRNVVLAGAGTTFVGNVGGNTATAGFTTAMTASVESFTYAAEALKVALAPTFVIGGIEGYVALITPRQEVQLLSNSAFRDVISRTNPENFRMGYMGYFMGIHFVRSTQTPTTTVNSVTVEQAIVFGKDAYGVPTLNVAGESPASKIAGFTGFAAHENITDQGTQALLDGFRIMVIERDPNGAHGDEYGLYSKVSAKAYFNTVILNSAWIVKVQTAR